MNKEKLIQLIMQAYLEISIKRFLNRVQSVLEESWRKKIEEAIEVAKVKISKY